MNKKNYYKSEDITSKYCHICNCKCFEIIERIDCLQKIIANFRKDMNFHKK